MKPLFRAALFLLALAIHLQASDFQTDSAAKAKQDYLRSLQAALGEAISANNSEEVNRISQEISRLSAGPAGAKPQAAADKIQPAQSPSAAPTVPGKIRVIEVEGAGSATIDKQGRRQTIEQGLFLSQGTRILTGPESSVVLAFENGSQVVVKPGSDFSVDKFLQNPFDSEEVDYHDRENEPTTSVTRNILQKGEIFFRVAKLSKNSSYQIVTPIGTAGIRGTGGFVRSGKTGAFGLYEGSAIFSTPIGQVLTINANQSIGIGDSASRYAISTNPTGNDKTLAMANRQMTQVAEDMPPKPFGKAPLPQRNPTPEPNPGSLLPDSDKDSSQIPANWDFNLQSNTNLNSSNGSTNKRTFSYDTGSGWLNTNIVVKKGQKINIQSSDKWSPNGGKTSIDANGINRKAWNGVSYTDKLAHGRLIAWITGSPGNYIDIGSSKSFIAETAES